MHSCSAGGLCRILIHKQNATNEVCKNSDEIWLVASLQEQTMSESACVYAHHYSDSGLRNNRDVMCVWFVMCSVQMTQAREETGVILNLNHLFRNAQNIAVNIQSEYT